MGAVPSGPNKIIETSRKVEGILVVTYKFRHCSRSNGMKRTLPELLSFQMIEYQIIRKESICNPCMKAAILGTPA